MATAAVVPVLDHASHSYTLNGKPLVSVSKVIDTVMAKSWAGVDPEILRNAAERGQRVEELATTWMRDGGVVTAPDERQDVLDRLECFGRWYERKKPELLDAQRLVWNETEETAGTLDFLLKIDGMTWLVDMKCTAKPEAAWGLQVGAYRRMTFGVDRCAVLHINPSYADGYIWREYNAMVVDSQWTAALRWYRVLKELKAS